jgi:hypothetical protein
MRDESCDELGDESCDGTESCLYEVSKVDEQDKQPPGYLRNVCADDKATIKMSTARKKASSSTL